MEGRTDRHIDGQIDRQTDRQTQGGDMVGTEKHQERKEDGLTV